MQTDSSINQRVIPALQKTGTWAFTLIELLVVITIIAILAGIALPVFSSVQIKGSQTKDLSNAKQIALGLRLYANDNNDAYPQSDPTGAPLTPTGNGANGAYANLIPQYIPVEKIFFLAKSAWNTRNGIIQSGDELLSSGTSWGASAPNTLSSGENNFAYVSNLNDSSNPSYPLIADGFSAVVGTYDSNQANKGGVWFGRNAIVIFCDGSGIIEKCNPLYQVTGITPDSAGASTANLFSSTADWLTSCQVLNPL